jgi:hypothetical protein
VSRRSYVCVNVDVDVEIDSVLDALTDDDIVEIFKQRFPSRSVAVPQGAGDGDRQPQQYVEAAFLAAKALPDCPREISDLFWHVHGRAM